MRVIAGQKKGKKLERPKVDFIRPTTDKVKESMFAMIQDRINDRIALDLFAGTGSLGLEAISNGAEHCYFVDRNFKCTQIIAKDIQTFGIQDKATVLTMNWQKALSFFKEKNIQFDLVFLDPPYKDFVIADSIQSMKELNLLKKGAWIICEMEQNYEQIKSRVITHSAFTLIVYFIQ